MAQIIDGKKIAQEIKDEIKEQVEQLKAGQRSMPGGNTGR